MASTLTSLSLSTPRAFSIQKEYPKPQQLPQSRLSGPWVGNYRTYGRRAVVVASGPSTPPGISEKVSESIKKAEEVCEGDAVSGECAAAWDEVEELSAAASHAREKIKSSDPLEEYCKDNPETDECRTYED